MSVLQFSTVCVTSLSDFGAFQSGTIWSQLSPVPLAAAQQSYNVTSTRRQDTARYQAHLEVQCDYVVLLASGKRHQRLIVVQNDKITITVFVYLLHVF